MQTFTKPVAEFQAMNKVANDQGKQAMVVKIEDTTEGRMITFGFVAK